MKLWELGEGLDRAVERFTVGDDPILDQRLVPYDCEASAVHALMLAKIGLLTDAEAKDIRKALDRVVELHKQGSFPIRTRDEDCHTAIENFLTEELGDLGKKIHLGRSRNDQVLTALRLLQRAEIRTILEKLNALHAVLNEFVDQHGEIQLPGYTHMRPAMPSSIGLWLSCYADALEDDRTLTEAVLSVVDQSPLGTAAGFGVPVFQPDRAFTAQRLGFPRVQENPIYAQLSRGKFEASVIHAMSQIMYDLNRLATDLITFSMKELGFVTLHPSMCTGSSIMPQKQNPDVLELLRAKYHTVLGEEVKVKSLSANLLSGYNRDLQLTKGPLMNALDITHSSLTVMTAVIGGLTINEERCKAAMTADLTATEEVYKLVQQGVPFRDAYRQVAAKHRK